MQCMAILGGAPKPSQPRKKRERPRKENFKKEPKLLAKESIKQENKPTTKVVRIRVLDPDATDSSSEEEEEVLSRKKVKVHKIQIPYDSHLHEKQRRELLSIKREGRREKAKKLEKKNGGISSCASFEGVHGGEKQLESLVKVHKHEKQSRELMSIKNEGRRENGGLSSCSSCTSFEGVDGGDKELESLATMPGLPDVPGPIPDLEKLMKDASSFLVNFFDGLPEE